MHGETLKKKTEHKNLRATNFGTKSYAGVLAV